MKKYIKTGGILLSLFGISFGIAFMSQYKERKTIDIPSTPSKEPASQTNQQKLLSNLMKIKAFDVNAQVEAMTPESNKVGIAFDGKGDVSDLENIKLEGKADANLDGNIIPIEISYVDSTTYFAYRDSKFRIDMDSIFEFIEKLPTVYGIELEVPGEIKDLNLGDLVDSVNKMEDKKITPEGDLCFRLNLSEDVEIFIKTDADNNFKGIRTNHFFYNETLFYLNIDLNTTDFVEIIKPDAKYYQDFKPVFTIFDGIYNLTKKRQNTINVDLDLKKQIKDTTTDDEGNETVTKTSIKKLVGTNLDLSYDLDNKLYSLDGKILANEKESPFNFALYNKKLFARYSDLKVSVQLDSVTALLDYALAKIGEDKLEDTINKLMDKMKDINILEYIENADKMIGDIVLTDTNLDVDLAPSEAGFNNISDFKLTLSFDASGLKSLAVTNLAVKDYYADLVLTFKDYVPFTLVEDDYAELEPVLGLIDAYENYLSRSEQKFQLAFNGNVTNNDETIKPINIDGNIQFEIDPERSKETNIGYGYGYVNIVDRDEYTHNIKADMKSVDEILFTYNDSMNGKAQIRTLKELAGLVMDIVKNPDEHFKELFGEIIEKINNMPIKQVIDGDYMQLLTTNLIDRFETGEKDGVYYIEIDVALDVINFSEYGFTLRLEYVNEKTEVYDEELGETYLKPNPIIKSLKLSNCNIGEENIELNINLYDYDYEKDITRLDPYLEYIDFSDIKVLLQLGINTSKFNYYHFTANAKLALTSINLANFNIPIDIKLHSQKGNIKIAAEFTDIPLITGVNKSSSLSKYGSETNRIASIYYNNKEFYISRTDTSQTGIFFKTTYKTTLTRRCDLDYMGENVLNILLQDIMGLSDTIMNMIDRSAGGNEGTQMHYEKILKNFMYNANEHYFFFDIDIGELAKNKQLSNLTLKVRTDNSNEQLVGLDAHLGIAVGITINIDLSLDIADRAEVADDSNKIVPLETFMAAHANDTLNELFTNTVKI